MIEYKKPIVKILTKTTSLGVVEIASRTCYDSIKNIKLKRAGGWYCIDEYSFPGFNEKYTHLSRAFDTIGEIDDGLSIEKIRARLERWEYDEIISTLFKEDPSFMLGYVEPNLNFIRKIALDGGHSSVLEHYSITFQMTFPRNVLQELSRHRIGISPSVKSTRYTLKTMRKLFMDMNRSEGDYSAFLEYLEDNYGIIDKRLSDITSSYIIEQLEMLGDEVTNDDIKNILPEHWLTTGVYTINLRALYNLLNLRLNTSAFFPFRMLVFEMYKQLPYDVIKLFGDEFKERINSIMNIMDEEK